MRHSAWRKSAVLVFLFVSVAMHPSFSQHTAVAQPISPSASASSADQGGFHDSPVQDAQAPDELSPSLSARPAYPGQVLIGEGDLIEISIYGTNDFNKDVRVDNKGEISLPLLGSVKVAGLTTAQAEEKIAKLLTDGQYFNDPQVAVLQKEYSIQGVSVLGEVQKPGIYPLLGRRTLFDALSAASGTTPNAGKYVTIAHRDHKDQPIIVTISYSPDAHKVGDTPILPGDTIVVSRAGIVYVVGDVHLPSGIVMENSNLTVLQALAMAQGANPTASLNHAKIIRRTSDGRQEVPIQLKKILASKAPDPVLYPDDIIFVPSSTAKAVARRSVDAAVQTAVGVAIYRP
jgi:polysaccharide biosynthesis/export protein